MSARYVLNGLHYVIDRYLRTHYYTSIAQLRFRIHQVDVGQKLSVRGPLNLYVHHTAHIEIGHYCRINSGFHRNPVGHSSRTTIWVGRGAQLRIGNRVGMSNLTIVSMNSVIIEDEVYIGGDCKIYDTDFHPLSSMERLQNLSPAKVAPILIKRASFIGGHSIILKGLTIGEGAVIGAGSVVTRDIPDFEIWAGNPARFVRRLDEAELEKQDDIKS